MCQLRKDGSASGCLRQKSRSIFSEMMCIAALYQSDILATSATSQHILDLAPIGQLPPFDDFGKRPSERLLNPGTCSNPNSHNLAGAAVQTLPDRGQLFCCQRTFRPTWQRRSSLGSKRFIGCSPSDTHQGTSQGHSRSVCPVLHRAFRER